MAAAACVLNIALLLVLVSFVATKEEFIYGKFPDNFIWGSATSAYQIEGGWNAGGKGMSIWDKFVRTPGKIKDGSTGDVACDSYNNYAQDVRILQELGVSSYRFSFSWPRIMPDGTNESVSNAGVNYYHKVLDGLLAKNITPQVTLYHWDLPQALEEYGGWLNESTTFHFEEFCKFCFREYGTKVKFWITINEPLIVANNGYGQGSHAPGIVDPNGTYVYAVGHNLLLAHARAWHAYNNGFRDEQKGKIGITLNGGWAEPKTDRQVDKDAAERALQFDFGWYAHPIWMGDYPEQMKTQIAEKSRRQGFKESRLPEFTAGQKTLIKGTSDFYGINFYSANLISHLRQDSGKPSYDNDKDIKSEADPSWPKSGSDWLRVTPFGMRRILAWIKKTYRNPDVYITENGVSDNHGSLKDKDRVHYFKYYINNVLQAINLDECNVKGYFAWSLMDNFEWMMGYTEKFGIYHVDFNNAARPRTAKDSAKYLQQLIKDNGFKSGFAVRQYDVTTIIISFLVIYFNM